VEVGGVKMENLLNTPFFKETVVLAGQEGLAKEVHSVNMMDAPDIIDYLEKEQLLLTTGYSIKNKAGALLQLVEQMAAQGCAGLGLKVERFLKDIPEEVIDAANRLHFPIIELPQQRSLGDIMTHILKLILQERTEELDYALKVHRQFSDIIMSGKGLHDVIDRLANIIDSPVLLMSHRLETLAASKKYSDEFYFEIASQINDELAKRDISSQDMLTLHITYPYINRKQVASLFSVHTNVYQKGFLIVFKEVANEPSTTLLAIEQAANVASFELMKRHAVEQHGRMLKNEFLTDFVEGHYSSEKDIAKRGNIYNLKRDQHYICVASKLDDEEDLNGSLSIDKETHMQMYKDAIYEQLSLWLRYYFDDYIIFTKGDIYLFLIGTEELSNDPEREVMKNITHIQAEVFEHLYLSMSFGIGHIADTLLHVPESYREALDALRSGYRSEKRRFVQNCDAKGVAELLRAVAPQKLKEFYQSSLKTLAESTRKDEQDLIETLRVYIEKNGQIAETAKALFIHRNTVIYRIKKCEERLNIDLKNADDIHKIRTALMIRSII
jgi:purine catabolism regulator